MDNTTDLTLPLCSKNEWAPKIITVCLLFICIAIGAGGYLKTAKKMLGCPAALKSYPLIFNMLIIGILVIWVYCPLRLTHIIYIMAKEGNVTQTTSKNADGPFSHAISSIWTLTELNIYVCLSGLTIQRVRVMACPVGRNPPSKTMEYITIAVSWLMGLAASIAQMMQPKHASLHLLLTCCLLCISIMVTMYTVCCKIAWRRPGIQQTANNVDSSNYMQNALIFPIKAVMIPLALDTPRKIEQDRSPESAYQSCPESVCRGMSSMTRRMTDELSDGSGGSDVIRSHMGAEGFSDKNIGSEYDRDGICFTPVLPMRDSTRRKRTRNGSLHQNNGTNADDVFFVTKNSFFADLAKIPTSLKRKRTRHINFQDSPTSMESFFLPGTPEDSPDKTHDITWGFDDVNNPEKSNTSSPSSPELRSLRKYTGLKKVKTFNQHNNVHISAAENMLDTSEQIQEESLGGIMGCANWMTKDSTTAKDQCTATSKESSSTFQSLHHSPKTRIICESDVSLSSVSPMSSLDLKTPANLKTLCGKNHNTLCKETLLKVSKDNLYRDDKITKVSDGDLKSESSNAGIGEERDTFEDMLKSFKSATSGKEYQDQHEIAITLHSPGESTDHLGTEDEGKSEGLGNKRDQILNDNIKVRACVDTPLDVYGFLNEATTTDYFTEEEIPGHRTPSSLRNSFNQNFKLLPARGGTQLDVYEFLNEAEATDYVTEKGIPTYVTPSSLDNSLNSSGIQSNLAKKHSGEDKAVPLNKMPVPEIDLVNFLKERGNNDENTLHIQVDEDSGDVKQRVDCEDSIEMGESSTDNPDIQDESNVVQLGNKMAHTVKDNIKVKFLPGRVETPLDVYAFLNEAATTDYFVEEEIPGHQTPSCLNNGYSSEDHINHTLLPGRAGTKLDVYEFLQEAETTDYFTEGGIPTYITPSSLDNSLNSSGIESNLQKINVINFIREKDNTNVHDDEDCYAIKSPMKKKTDNNRLQELNRENRTAKVAGSENSDRIDSENEDGNGRTGELECFPGRSQAEFARLMALLNSGATSTWGHGHVPTLSNRRQSELSTYQRHRDNRKIVCRALMHILHVVFTFFPLAIVRIVTPSDVCSPIGEVEHVLESIACLGYIFLPIIYVKKNNGLKRLLRIAEHWADVL